MATSATNVGLIGYQFLHWRISVTYAGFFGKAGQKTTADATFSNNVAQSIPVTLTAQRVQASDVNSGNAMVKEMVGAINAYNSFCDKYPTYLAKFKLSFAPASPASIGLSDLSDISVSNVTNGNVQFAGISGTPSSPQIKFTTHSTTDQNFNFDITYNDGVNPVKKATISGVIGAATTSILTKWFFEKNVSWGDTDTSYHSDGRFLEFKNDGSYSVFIPDNQPQLETGTYTYNSSTGQIFIHPSRTSDNFELKIISLTSSKFVFDDIADQERYWLKR